MIDAAREQMRQACARPENAFGEAFFVEHVTVMRDTAIRLADTFEADPEIVELAAYLHDIAAVQDFSALLRHAELGADLAAQFLAEQGYPRERIQRVRDCILTHSTPLPPGQATPEQVCISQADAVAQLLRPAYWLWYAFVPRAMDYKTGREWYRQRIESHWNAIAAPAKALARDAYLLDCALLQIQPSE
jgi:uncharacterized protein